VNDECDCRGRCRALGHQGQGLECASLSIVGRRFPGGGAGVRPRQRSDIEETVKSRRRLRQLGYKAIRAQSGIPGCKAHTALAAAKWYYEPRKKDAPIENAWSSELYLNFVPRLFERLRKEFGANLSFAARRAPSAHPRSKRRAWEEPRALSSVLARGSCSRGAATKLPAYPVTHHYATGRRRSINSIYMIARRLIQEQLIDYIGPPLVHAWRNL